MAGRPDHNELVTLFGADVELPAGWREAWDAALASFPSRGVPFLNEEFVLANAAAAGVSGELTAGLVQAAASIRSDSALCRVAWFLHTICFSNPMPSASEIWHWPFNSRPLPRHAALLPALVVLAGAPALYAAHRRCGIPEQVTRDTLQDIEV